MFLRTIKKIKELAKEFEEIKKSGTKQFAKIWRTQERKELENERTFWNTKSIVKDGT